MDTFIQIIDNIGQKYKLWDYYDGKYDIRNSSGFIKNFIKDAGKSEASLFEFIDEIKKKYSCRLEHIVNTFLLGFYFYTNADIVNRNVDKHLNRYRINGRSIDFAFIWFLICLFHDLGYIKEADSENFKHSLKDEVESLKYLPLRRAAGVPKFYKKIYKNYLDYTATKLYHVDHGIYGGLTLFKDLCEIRARKETEKRNQNDNIDLYWGKDLIKVYNYAAWIILAHNIWFATTPRDRDQYEKHNLSELIVTSPGNYKISCSKHPLLFLFCLVDTLEPQKKILCKDLLNSISWGVKRNSLYISFAKDIKNCSKITAYKKSISELNNWLTPTSSCDCIFKISLNQKTF